VLQELSSLLDGARIAPQKAMSCPRHVCGEADQVEEWVNRRLQMAFQLKKGLSLAVAE